MGGELHSYIYEQPDNKFKEKDAKFYLAQVRKEEEEEEEKKSMRFFNKMSSFFFRCVLP